MPKSHWTWLALLAGLLLIQAPAAAQEEDPKEEPKPAAEEKPAEQPKPAEPKPEEPKPEEPKPAAEPKPAEPKPAEPKPAEPAEPAEPAAEAKEVTTRTVVINLDNPCGLVVHESGQVFIASHDGVHRFQPADNTCPLAISGFPTDVYGKGPEYKISALGLAFIDKEHLVVADGSRVDGEELARVYKIPEKHPGKYMKEDEAVYTFGPFKAQEGVTVKGEGNFYSAVVVGDRIVFSANGDDTKGWVLQVQKKDGKWDGAEITGYIPTKERVAEAGKPVDAPVPVAVGAGDFEGQLVIGQMGEVNVPGDSLLTVYDMEGKLVALGEMDGLSDVAGLAYSPKTKKWYATDFAWADATQGALYELDIQVGEAPAPAQGGGPKPLTIKKTKLATLDKPTAVVADADGNLYVAVFGTGKEGDQMSPGKLLKISSDQLK
jgi:hypothetical protein